MSLSVIIPSRNLANLSYCADAVQQQEPGCDVIAVWDASRGSQRIEPTNLYRVHTVESDFVYARNCNLGIMAADPNDIILLNDDGLLRTPGGFTALQRAADQHPEYGIIASTTNVTGYHAQLPQNKGLRATNTVAFVCVLIPRRTIDLIGLLDERFVTYGWEDVDYCRRVRNAGLKVGVFDGCYVDHGTLFSSFRGAALGNLAPGDIAPGRKIYLEKWGNCDAW